MPFFFPCTTLAHSYYSKNIFNIIYFYDYVYKHKYSLRFYMFVAIVFFSKSITCLYTFFE